jgi:hypothetical protein
MIMQPACADQWGNPAAQRRQSVAWRRPSTVLRTSQPRILAVARLVANLVIAASDKPNAENPIVQLLPIGGEEELRQVVSASL